MKKINSSGRKRLTRSNSGKKPETPKRIATAIRAKTPSAAPIAPIGRVCLRDILDRLQDASTASKELTLSAAEADKVFCKIKALDFIAGELPIWVQNKSRELPAEILEFVEGQRIPGSIQAESERNRKWMEFFHLRSWQYLNQIFTLLNGPSRVESDAATLIRDLMDGILSHLEEIKESTDPQLQNGARAAAETYRGITKAFAAKVDTPRKARSRARKNAGRVIKPHSSEFTQKCEFIVRDIITEHFDRLENPDYEPIFYNEQEPKSKIPNSPFGFDDSARGIWEEWILGYLKDRICIRNIGGDALRLLWTSHLSDLKNRLIPGYWDKAVLWRTLWNAKQIEFL